MVIPLVGNGSSEGDNHDVAVSKFTIHLVADEMDAATMVVWVTNAAMSVMPVAGWLCANNEVTQFLTNPAGKVSPNWRARHLHLGCNELRCQCSNTLDRAGKDFTGL